MKLGSECKISILQNVLQPIHTFQIDSHISSLSERSFALLWMHEYKLYRDSANCFLPLRLIPILIHMIENFLEKYDSQLHRKWKYWLISSRLLCVTFLALQPQNWALPFSI